MLLILLSPIRESISLVSPNPSNQSFASQVRSSSFFGLYLWRIVWPEMYVVKKNAYLCFVPYLLSYACTPLLYVCMYVYMYVFVCLSVSLPPFNRPWEDFPLIFSYLFPFLEQIVFLLYTNFNLITLFLLVYYIVVPIQF